MEDSTTTILRPATDAERKDFIDLTSKKSSVDKIFDTIAKKQLEYQAKEKPFCSRCARLDVEDKVHRIGVEGSRKILGEFEESKVSIDLLGDLDKYGDIKRFEQLDSTPVFENKLIDGMKKSVETGRWDNYRCKERGCGLSIFIEKKDATAKK